MYHPDSGTVQAFLDGEVPEADREAMTAHIDGCTPCSQALAEQREAGTAVARALSSTDVVLSVEGVRSSIRQRANAQNRARTAIPWARAAVLVLLFGGAASAAIPGSPLRSLVDSLFSGDPTTAPALVSETATDDSAISPSAGVGVSAAAGSVRIVLSEVAPGAEVEVTFVDGVMASVTAGENATFSTAPGVVEVSRAGAPIRVEIPRGVEGATVEVDGALFLRKVGPRIELVGPAEDSTAAAILFRVPG